MIIHFTTTTTTTTTTFAFLPFSDNIELMEQELNFWLHNRTTVVSHEGRTFKVAQYNARVDEPRPESYRWNFFIYSLFAINLRHIFFYKYF